MMSSEISTGSASSKYSTSPSTSGIVMIGGIDFHRINVGRRRVVRFTLVNGDNKPFIITNLFLQQQKSLYGHASFTISENQQHLIQQSLNQPQLSQLNNNHLQNHHDSTNALSKHNNSSTNQQTVQPFSIMAKLEFPIVIEPHQEFESYISFSPPTSGWFTALLSIQSYSSGTKIQQVSLHGEGDQPSTPTQIIYSDNQSPIIIETPVKLNYNSSTYNSGYSTPEMEINHNSSHPTFLMNPSHSSTSSIIAQPLFFDEDCHQNSISLNSNGGLYPAIKPTSTTTSIIKKQQQQLLQQQQKSSQSNVETNTPPPSSSQPQLKSNHNSRYNSINNNHNSNHHFKLSEKKVSFNPMVTEREKSLDLSVDSDYDENQQQLINSVNIKRGNNHQSSQLQHNHHYNNRNNSLSNNNSTTHQYPTFEQIERKLAEITKFIDENSINNSKYDFNRQIAYYPVKVEDNVQQPQPQPPQQIPQPQINQRQQANNYYQHAQQQQLQQLQQQQQQQQQQQKQNRYHPNIETGASTSFNSGTGNNIIKNNNRQQQQQHQYQTPVKNNNYNQNEISTVEGDSRVVQMTEEDWALFNELKTEKQKVATPAIWSDFLRPSIDHNSSFQSAVMKYEPTTPFISRNRVAK